MRALVLQLGEHLTRVEVVGTIVDDEDFRRGPCLALHGVERFAQCSAEIVARDNRGDRLPVHAPVRLSHHPYTALSGAVTRQLIEFRNASTSAAVVATAASRRAICCD